MAADWPTKIFDQLKAGDIRQMVYVPDAGHTDLINACIADPDMVTTSVSTEEEGIALLYGAWLGGDRGVMLMQSSGVGNCPNMLASAITCRMPVLMLVTMRGEFGEFNPWQNPMGQATGAVLQAMGTQIVRLDDAEQTEDIVRGAINMSFNGLAPLAVLIGQRMIGAKGFDQ